MTMKVSAEEAAAQRLAARQAAEILGRRETPPLAYVRTYGCRQNVSDGEKLKGMLCEMGCGLVSSPDNADIIIFNTCAVRENAEDRVFGNLGMLKALKRAKPDMIIGLCGCMAQQEHVSERIKRSFPYVDIVFGTHALHTLPSLILGVLTDGKRRFSVEKADGVIAEGLPICREDKIHADIPIMYGCDNFCSYCVVPYVRGRERSRELADVIGEVTEAVNGGAKDILLLGQNVNSYGKGIGSSFPELLRAVNAVEGDFRVSYMSSHPKDATNELIDTVAECEKVVRHFHLPVQSGSTRILGLMNRRYTREDYLRTAEYIRTRIPDASLTSDIIVGFPGETREDFEQTLSLIEQVRFDSLFTFIYSPRRGTKAAEMPDPISAKEKGEWFRELLAVQQPIGGEMYERYVGDTCRVLCTGEGRTDSALLTGKTPQNVGVDFAGDRKLVGSFVDVRITKALEWILEGERVER